MYEEPDEVIRAEPGPNEQLLWAGRPRQGIVFRSIDIFFIPFSLMWGGFAIFWEVSVLNTNAPWFAALWGVPFVLMGLYMILGRFWVDAWQRENTQYAVTSQRVIIRSGVFAQTVKSLNIDTITDLSLSERSNGSGTITFGAVPPFYGWYGTMQSPWMNNQMVPSFELASDARKVYDIVRTAQLAAKQLR